MKKENNFIICIPTKDRPEVLRKFLDYHYREKYDYVVAIEHQDEKKYLDVIAKYIEVDTLLIENDLGLGYSRNRLATYALENNYDYTIFSDDNAKFDINKIEDFVKVIDQDKRIVFLGGYHNLYDIFYRARNFPENTVFSAHRYASIVFCIRTSIFKEENYDVNLRYPEDNDFLLRLHQKFYPENSVFIYKGFRYSKARNQPGGCSKFKSEIQIKKVIDYINKKHGMKIVTFDERKKDLRFHWAKFFQRLKEKSEQMELSLK